MTDQITIFGEADERTLEQARACLAAEEGAIGVLCADNHLGYSQPVGMAVAYRDHISPAGVGYDIGCGNKAVGTGILAADINVAGVMDQIFDVVDFGIGRNQSADIDHPVLDRIRETVEPDLYDKAANQLGSTGGGNHYVDLFEDRASGELVIGVHFGSRGFGHTIASNFVKDGSLMAPPKLLRLGTAEADEYLGLMELAGEYAYAGRDVVVDKVLGILGGVEPTWGVHNHHNYAWREEHFGEDFWVIRKGCTPAFPGQQGFVGATMGEDSVILSGSDDGSVVAEQRGALFSTVHGAGRAMSRTEAAGKKRKRWACTNRECDWVQPPRSHKPEHGCPKCESALTKIWVQEREGRLDWGAERERMGTIELRGGAVDEAPGAYKRLPDVLSAQGDTIRVLKTLRPVGVAMAPSGVAADD